ncbi:MAG TPA: hypothetical protein VHE35_29260, partial [Kofleriaceae bacterium]|nr:hypothetical protein [Kofleriaceae bacterium]
MPHEAAQRRAIGPGAQLAAGRCMQVRQELGSIAGGLVGGVIGTAAIRGGMKLQQRLPAALQGPPMKQDPGEYIVERFEERRGEPLAPPAHARAAHALPWVYGLGWSSVLALLGPAL